MCFVCGADFGEKIRIFGLLFCAAQSADKCLLLRGVDFGAARNTRRARSARTAQTLAKKSGFRVVFCAA